MRSILVKQGITNRLGTTEYYLAEIAKINLLPPDEESELCIKVKNGDKEAEEKLIKSNLRFVISVAKQFQRNDVELQDLIQAGNIGLIEAAGRFDQSRGFKFISYAVWWVRNHIMSELRNKFMIRIPDNKYMNDRKVEYQNEKFHQELNTGTINTEYKIESVASKVSAYLGDMNESREEPLEALIKSDYDEEKFINEIDSLEFEKKLLSILDEREFFIIKSAMGIGTEAKSFNDIALDLNLTRERCRQIYCLAIARLKRNKKNFIEFLN